MNQKLFNFIAASPTAFHAVAESAAQLQSAGFSALNEGEAWTLEPGKGYYVTRNLSSLIAFRVPECGAPAGFLIAAAHGDSPAFKIKEHEEIKGQYYVQLSVERYGGMILPTWFDRPLSVAGRVIVRTETGIETRLVDLREPVCLIPNVAIHMNRNINDGYKYNPAVDLLPLYGVPGGKSLRSRIAEAAGAAEEDVLAHDLIVYLPERGVEWGEFISCPRLDDQQCAFAALTALLDAKNERSMPVFALFDNEEVGSGTKQGAASTFLRDTLRRAGKALGMDGEDYRRAVAASFLASCDNAHAVHPNHGELSDRNHSVTMNGGVVIKYNASQRYTSDGVSAGLFRVLCERAGVNVQLYANRADLPGGGTLGNISNTQVSLNAVDIGLAQLAMHSTFETAGARDTEAMVKALRALFASSLHVEADGIYTLR